MSTYLPNLAFILTALLFSFGNFAGRDHAALFGHRLKACDYAHHEDAAEKFKNINFREHPDGPITLDKAQSFFAQLDKEYQRNISKSYETVFLEQLDIKKASSIKADKKARQFQLKNNVLAPYELYLFPKMKELMQAIERDEQDHAEGLLDDFVRGYIPYFNPNPYNNILINKINLPSLVKRIFTSPLRKKNTNTAQANNLVLENREQVVEITGLLKEENADLQVGSFLTQEQLATLLACNYDISQLNPGESALWKSDRENDQKSLYDRDPRLFPADNTKKYFHKVMLGGSASTKIQLKFKNIDGITRKIKLKVGDEVYSELATAALLKLLGYSGDRMVYAGDVKFYLGQATFDNFESEIRFKFGQISNPRFIFERGQDDNGERYIIWRDALFEAHPENEIRISPIDIASWDLQNRREYRALELAMAWLGINDLKDDNFKALLINQNGKWLPEHRLHDVGFSLGASLVMNKPNDFLNLQDRKGKVNEFETKIVNKKNDGIVIRWNDFYHQDRKYLSSTYYDHKWMARKIARIRADDLERAFSHSGMHPDLAHLYTIKLIMRRNNIVESFELQDEFPLYPVPDNIQNYSPPEFPSIKKGRIDLTAYRGKVALPKRVTTWGSTIGHWFSGQSIPEAHAHKKIPGIQATWSGSAQVGGANISMDWRKTSERLGSWQKSHLQPGFSIIPRRTVIQNSQNFNTNLRDKNGQSIIDSDGNDVMTNLPYIVIDQLKFIIGVKASTHGLRFLPATASAGANFVERRVTHYHFAETIKEGWLSPFRVAKVITQDVDKFAAQNLSDLEAIDSYLSYGANLHAELKAKIIASSTGIAAGLHTQKRKFLYRDQFGQLHHLTDQANISHAGAGLNLLRADLLVCNAVGLQLDASRSSTTGRLTEYIVTKKTNPSADSHDHLDRNDEQTLQELDALRLLACGQTSPDIILNFDRRYQSQSNSKQAGLLFLLNYRKNTQWGQIEDIYSDGRTQNVFQHSVTSGSFFGKKIAPLPILSTLDLAIKKGKSKQTIVEAEMRAPEKFIITVKNKVFARKQTKKELEALIKKINARYSKDFRDDASQLFFSNLVLPEEENQNEYRKIYGMVKVLVDGEFLLEKIRAITINDLEPIISRFFDEDSLLIKKAHWNHDEFGQYLKKSNHFTKKSRLANTLSYAKKKQQIMADFKLLQRLLNNPHSSTKDWSKIWIASRDLVHHLCSRYYGIQLLKAFLNINARDQDLDKGLLVYGEMQNIGDQVTMLQRPFSFQANLRNTGNHWGNFSFGKEKIRPVQHFLKYQDATQQVPYYLQPFVSSPALLGFLEKGLAENYSGEGI